MSGGEKGRATRSAAVEGAESEMMFDFEHEYEIDAQKSLEVVSRLTKTSGKLLSLDGVSDTRSSIGKMVLDIEDHPLVPTGKTDASSADGVSRVDTETKPDPLDNQVYAPFHKKMIRQENRWMEMDVQESHETADQLQLLQNKLEMVTWPVTLQKVTRINNPDDTQEMEHKRKLTFGRISEMLHKYELMQRHASALRQKKSKKMINPLRDWPKIYQRVDRMFVEGYESSSDEEEEEMSVEQIRNRRIEIRRKTCGGRITIGLCPKNRPPSFAIVAEPLQKPYVIKLSGKEKSDIVSRGIPDKVFNYSSVPQKKYATIKGSKVIPRTMTLTEEEKQHFVKKFSSDDNDEQNNIDTSLQDITLESDFISDVPEETPPELRLISLDGEILNDYTRDEHETIYNTAMATSFPIHGSASEMPPVVVGRIGKNGSQPGQDWPLSTNHSEFRNSPFGNGQQFATLGGTSAQQKISPSSTILGSPATTTQMISHTSVLASKMVLNTSTNRVQPAMFEPLRDYKTFMNNLQFNATTADQMSTIPTNNISSGKITNNGNVGVSAATSKSNIPTNAVVSYLTPSNMLTNNHPTVHPENTAITPLASENIIGNDKKMGRTSVTHNEDYSRERSSSGTISDDNETLITKRDSHGVGILAASLSSALNNTASNRMPIGGDTRDEQPKMRSNFQPLNIISQVPVNFNGVNSTPIKQKTNHVTTQIPRKKDVKTNTTSNAVEDKELPQEANKPIPNILIPRKKQKLKKTYP